MKLDIVIWILVTIWLSVLTFAVISIDAKSAVATTSAPKVSAFCQDALKLRQIYANNGVGPKSPLWAWANDNVSHYCEQPAQKSAPRFPTPTASIPHLTTP